MHLGPHLGRLRRLRSVVLAGGGEYWGLEAWLRELGQALPNGLQQLQIKFARWVGARDGQRCASALQPRTCSFCTLAICGLALPLVHASL